VNYNGSYHCGQIAFAVTGELTEAVECNCSICSRKGALLWRVPESKFRLLSPKAEGAGQAENPMVVVSIRCLEEVEPSALAVRHFDGRAL